jgi:hypothetical protein
MTLEGSVMLPFTVEQFFAVFARYNIDPQLL